MVLIFFLFPIITLFVGYKYGYSIKISATPLLPPSIIYKNLPIPTSIPYLKNDTSLWKEYSNNEFGYSIKYPSNFRIMAFQEAYGLGDNYIVNIKSRDIPAFGATNKDLAVTILVQKAKPDATLEKYGTSSVPANSFYEKQYFLTRQTVGNAPAIRWRSTGSGSNWVLVKSNSGIKGKDRLIQDENTYEQIVFIHNNNIFRIQKSPADTFQQNTFEDMLSSFTFLK